MKRTKKQMKFVWKKGDIIIERKKRRKGKS